jgi:hypothetical protein
MASLAQRPTDRIRPGWRIAALLLVYLALTIGFAFAWRLLGLPPQSRKGILDPVLLALTGSVLVGSILAASALTLRCLDDRPLPTIGIPLHGPWLRQTTIGLGFGASTPILYFLLACGLGAARVVHTPLDPHSLLTRTLPALLAFLLLSFHEELLLRGYLLQLISENRGRWVAAIASGVAFGLAHAGNTGANPEGLLYTAVSGVLLAWLVMRVGSLWIAGGYHFGWNAAAGLVLGLKVSGTTMPGSWIQTTTSGLRWISGGDYGFEGSVVVSLLELLILGLLVRLAPRLPAHPELCRFFDRQPRTRERPSA